MNIPKNKVSRWRVAYLALSLIIILFAGYCLWDVAASGIIPTKYILAGSAAYILCASLATFLLLRSFTTTRRQITARILAGTLLIVFVAASLFGLYLLRQGLSALDALSSQENAITINTNDSFSIFISGIDTEGDITQTSRSDVNIVATINPHTRKILLTTIPRDAYVAIPLGGQDEMDKLTHAGNYGPEASMGAVAALLDTEIKAYVRINFTSFIKGIDTLGGITVNNPEVFTSYDGKTFNAGVIQLNGDDALSYSRERKSLTAGDVDRGRNQQRVIQGIVDKASSIRSLSGLEAALDLIGTSIDTNMSQSTVRSLINRQLNNPSGWETESYTLTGKGSTGTHPSYAMPSAKLYMYLLDDTSVERATRQINDHKRAR